MSVLEHPLFSASSGAIDDVHAVADRVIPFPKIDSCHVILCNPNRLFIEGLARLLHDTRFDVVGSGATITAALREATCLGAARILICGLRDADDVEQVSSELQMAKSQLADLRVVLLADYVTTRLVAQAADCGVDAVLSNNISADVLLGALGLVLLGQRLFPPPPIGALGYGPDACPPVTASADPAVSADLDRVGHIPVLSEREDQILRFLASGTRNKLIAHDLGISEATVKFHIRALMRKLGAANRTQAAILGMTRTKTSA